MTQILLDMLVTGLPLVPVFLGIYTVFRLRADFDLTVEGSFVLGGAVCALTLVHGWPSWLALLAGTAGAAAAGGVTALIHLLLRVPVLLAGLVMSIGLFSVNLHVLDTPTLSLGTVGTLFSGFGSLSGRQADLATSGVMAGVVAAVLVAFGLFLRTELGLALRATGVNARMARSQGVNDRRLTVLALVLANGLAGLGASLAVQYQGYADVNMGGGTFVAGVGAVLLGELFVRPSGSKLVRIVGCVLVGTLAYRLVLVTALRVGLPAGDLRGVTALTLLVAIAAERYLGALGGLTRMLARNARSATTPARQEAA
ncbi:ABC transporter permease [Candidatus Frankia alpina]|nr:ABC transporter permease [Candidatus Frankia alpina]